MNTRLKARIIEIFGTQADFARAVREDEATVSRIIRGREHITQERRLIWGGALRLTKKQIFGLVNGGGASWGRKRNQTAHNRK